MFVDGAIEEDTLFKSGHFMNDLEMFTPKTSAFESLKSLGLNIIKNDSLRKDIITLYQITLPDLNWDIINLEIIVQVVNDDNS